jgi:CheY-specific phosphatase CheX
MTKTPKENTAKADEEIPPINRIIREVAIDSFNEFTGANATIKPVAKKDDFVYDFLMTIILTHCDSFDSMFKAHFSVATAMKITCQATGLEPDELTEEESIDFIKEYTNMFAGHFVGDLAQRGIRADISIPVTTSGFDEVVFTDIFYNDEYRDYWVLSFGDCGITITTNTKVKDTSVFADLEKEVLRKKKQPITFL